MLVFFTVVESELLKQAGLEKSQWGSTSTVRNNVRDPLVLDVWFLLHIGKGLISMVYLFVVVHPKP